MKTNWLAIETEVMGTERIARKNGDIWLGVFSTPEDAKSFCKSYTVEKGNPFELRFFKIVNLEDVMNNFKNFNPSVIHCAFTGKTEVRKAKSGNFHNVENNVRMMASKSKGWIEQV